ncbi:dienelactone hydrolase family protein [Amycolatopsis cihanbeyliensis]|uniref:dienelactone hydrolase family protein n=1 Tax=Amycolatopsis cihanbeyliensis TaxID=1128664 RepID=UPI001B86F0A3|nr:dienelactone hydrolase family protein [Amycolatopsis cihanbeyliensis]
MPPGAPVAVAEAGDLTLRAADGNRVLAYRAVPERGSGAGIVLLPDVRGLHDFYRELARRFAQAGVPALAIDYYGRTASDDRRGPDFDGFEHIAKLRPDHTAADIRVALEHLRSGALGEVGSAFTVGFCVGGALSWGQSALADDLAGAIGFYGRPEECRDLLPRMRAPLLVLAAGADVLTPAEEARRFGTELTEAGVPHRFELYEEAPHSFFDGGFAEHERACAHAWRQVLDFLAEHTAEAAGNPR